MKSKRQNRLVIILMILVFITMNSCIGITANISINSNGSGRLVMEYRISRLAEAIGRLDGNENMHIIPVGRTDLERTAARIDGMRLVSFSSREESNDLVNRVTLDFANMDALVKFFDPNGENASFTRQNGRNIFHFIVNKPPAQIDPDLMELMRQVSAGYNVNINFTAQGNSTITFTDGEGNNTSKPAGAEVQPEGRNVSFSMGTAEILELREGLGISFSW